MSHKKVVIIGAGGIVGQHMLVNKPDWADALFTRRVQDETWTQLNVGSDDITSWLDNNNPDVIVNLAGQNTVDTVEEDPDEYINVNIDLPILLAKWVNKNNKHLIQVSTQGIFSGENAEYNPGSEAHPITWYGKQKHLAEKIVLLYPNVEVVRLTFVIGVRPFQNIGRKNPLESMMEQKSQLQVDDRFFSPVFAYDAAMVLWDRVANVGESNQRIIHIGNPIKCSRFSIACDLKEVSDGKLDINVDAVSYKYFASDVSRPRDTTWKNGTSVYKTEYLDGLKKCYLEWERLNK